MSTEYAASHVANFSLNNFCGLPQIELYNLCPNPRLLISTKIKLMNWYAECGNFARMKVRFSQTIKEPGWNQKLHAKVTAIL